MEELSRSLLPSFQVYGGFPLLFLLLISSWIPPCRKTHSVILALSHFLRFVLCPRMRPILVYVLSALGRERTAGFWGGCLTTADLILWVGTRVLLRPRWPVWLLPVPDRGLSRSPTRIVGLSFSSFSPIGFRLVYFTALLSACALRIPVSVGGVAPLPPPSVFCALKSLYLTCAVTSAVLWMCVWSSPSHSLTLNPLTRLCLERVSCHVSSPLCPAQCLHRAPALMLVSQPHVGLWPWLPSYFWSVLSVFFFLPAFLWITLRIVRILFWCLYKVFDRTSCIAFVVVSPNVTLHITYHRFTSSGWRIAPLPLFVSFPLFCLWYNCPISCTSDCGVILLWLANTI